MRFKVFHQSPGKWVSILSLGILLCMASGTDVEAASFKVQWHQKISNIEGDFPDVLDYEAYFGVASAPLGDLDKDGNVDMVVGALGDNGLGSHRGAIWVLFLNSDGTVKTAQKIDEVEGNFFGTLDDEDYFGCSLAALGDLDKDGVVDIAVGARKDDDGGNNRGAVWVLFLNSDGTVKAHQKISDTAGGFSGGLDNGDLFGHSITSLGDIDNDGVADIAVGANWDDDGGANRGAVWILFLNGNGTVKAQQKISSTQGGFTGELDDEDRWGVSAAALGDLNEDGVADLAVGTVRDDDGGTDRGAVWILFLNMDGTVKSHQKISDWEGGFDGLLFNHDWFGGGLAFLGDLNKDDVVDLAVGSTQSDEGGPERGAVWILSLNNDGTVYKHWKISDIHGGFTGILNNYDRFGSSITLLGDLNGDQTGDLVVGARSDDDGGFDCGALWVIFLDDPASPMPQDPIYTFVGDNIYDCHGYRVDNAGDVNNDGVDDIIASAKQADYYGFNNCGMVRVYSGATGAALYTYYGSSTNRYLGASVSGAGDVNNDGYDDFIMGSDPVNLPPDTNSVWVCSGLDGSYLYIFMGKQGAHLKGGVSGAGDINGDGYDDFLVGDPKNDTAFSDGGAVHLFSGYDGSLMHSWFGTGAGQMFGGCVACAGDVNNDGVPDVMASNQYSTAFVFSGADYSNLYTFVGGAPTNISFGASMDTAGDVNGDGFDDMIFGAPGDDTKQVDAGAAMVYSGKDGVLLYTLYASQIPNPHRSEDFFGISVAGVGDVDKDGFDDLFVGAHEKGTKPANYPPGYSQLLSGVDGSVLRTYVGSSYNAAFGWSVSGIGDLNGDKVPDLIVGERYGDDHATDVGRVYVFSGFQAWKNLGGGKAGTHGVPELNGTGSLVPGTPYEVVLTNALENAPLTLEITFITHKSGNGNKGKGSGPMMGKQDYTMRIEGFTDGNGSYVYSAYWPANMASGQARTFRVKIRDPLGTNGYAVSNRLMGITP